MDEIDELYEIASGRAERDAGFLYADGTLNRWDQITRAEAIAEEKREAAREKDEEWWRRERPRHRFLAEVDMPNFCILCGVNKISHGRWAE